MKGNVSRLTLSINFYPTHFSPSIPTPPPPKKSFLWTLIFLYLVSVFSRKYKREMQGNILANKAFDIFPFSLSQLPPSVIIPRPPFRLQKQKKTRQITSCREGTMLYGARFCPITGPAFVKLDVFFRPSHYFNRIFPLHTNSVLS